MEYGYIDGYITPVEEGRKDEYMAASRKMAANFKRFGALRVVEAWSDDVPDGVKTSFAKAVQLQDGEKVVFSWIAWPSKEARDAGMKAFQQQMAEQPEPMPFDGSRMIFGGFSTLLDE